MRALLRMLKRDGWRFSRPVWRIDERGVGLAVYEASGPDRTYSLVCFGNDLPPEKRTDRVIAQEWDATFALHDGRPAESDLARLAANVPLQEAGRVSDREIVLLRANRSVRLFQHVVGALAGGQQPERAEIDRVGYLMRTTAVYGSGKFGLADRDLVSTRPELKGPYRAEMLAVWLARAFTIDWAEHMAALRGGTRSVRFERVLARRLGVGNATGLGMAPFLINHPTLFNNWILARETALARVRELSKAGHGERAAFRDMLSRALADAAGWRVDDAGQSARIAALERDLAWLQEWVAAGALASPRPWDGLYRRAEAHLSLEGQELLVTLLIEPHGALVDDLCEAMDADEMAGFRIEGAMPVETLRGLLDANYAWALPLDYAEPENSARFWYTSEEKLEPRLGERYQEPGGECEQPLGVGRDVAALRAALAHWNEIGSTAGFLLTHPEHRHTVRRVQLSAVHPYMEIRDNMIGAAMRPIDCLRCKLAFFGATRFDPKSDRWLRITLFQHAPLPDELATAEADDWAIPPLA